MNDAERQTADPDAAQDAPAADTRDAVADDPAVGDPRVDDVAVDEPVDEPEQPTPPAADDPDEAGDRVLDLVEAAEADPRSKAELLAELMEAEARRDEYLDDVRRARAEFENFRKRVMREGATQREHGKAAVVESLLEVLDDVDRTRSAAEASDDQGLARGVELMAGKLVQALQDNGLSRIDATGVPFDPALHEAVQQQEAEEPTGEPTVSQVLRPGYRFGDRVLRAAMVVVEQ